MKKFSIALVALFAVLVLTSCGSFFDGYEVVEVTPVATPVVTPVAQNPAIPSVVSKYHVESTQFGRIKINITSGMIRALGYRDGDSIIVRFGNGPEFRAVIYDNRMNLDSGVLGMNLSVFDDQFVEIEQRGSMDTAKLLGVNVNDPVYFPYLY